MAKITRVFQKLFGSTSGVQEVGQFGSLANGSPVYTTDPAVIQGLVEFTDGWAAAVLGDGNPCIQDMNALFLVAFYQLAYLLQQGVPEWNAATTYYIGSIAQDGNGTMFISTADNNLNNALDAGNWFPIGTVGPLNQTIGSQSIPVNTRVMSPSPVTLAASSTVNVSSTSVVIVPESVAVPPGSSLIVAPGGSVRVS